jgi:solute:Na+ symporter, SSS family
MLYVVFGIYFALMIGIGLFTASKARTMQDFFLGNRSVGPWISALAYGTSYFSAVLFIGYAGSQGWAFGLPILWVAAGNALIGCLLPWLILGRRTRTLTARLGVMTMPEFLEARYGSKALKVVSAVIIFVFLIPYSAAAYTGLSFLFESIFGIPYVYALMFITGLTAFYLVLGGYFAVALTDFVQGLIMLVGGVLMVVYVFGTTEVGGWSGLVGGLSRIDPELTRLLPAKWPSIMWLVILTSLGAWGMPQMVQKFYAIKNERVIPRAAIVGTLFCLVIAGAAYLVGSSSPLFGPALVAENAVFMTAPASEAAMEDVVVARGLINQAMTNETAKSPDPIKYKNTLIIPQILKKSLPSLLLYVVLVLVLSATMSTVSSLVLVSSSAITIDLLKGAVAPSLSKGREMVIMRALCLVFVVLSTYLSWQGPSFLVAWMSYSWGTIAGAFLGPYVLGLFWEKVSQTAVWMGMIAGLSISFVNFLGGNYGLFGITKADAPMYGSLAMLASLAVVALVTLIVPARLPGAGVGSVCESDRAVKSEGTLVGG